MQIGQLSPRAENIWAAIMATTTVGGSMFLACIFPFTALASLFAATMNFRKAAWWMGAAWLANQLVGYLILDYPRNATSFGHGLIIGVTAIATLWVAKAILDWRGDRRILSLAIAFGGSFIVYESLLLVGALFLGGVDTFAPSIVWQVLRNDLLWLTALTIGHIALSRLIFNRNAEKASLQY